MLLRIAGVLAALMAFTYAGYPVLAFLLSRLAAGRIRKERTDVSVSVILPVHNERERLEGKLCNLLEEAAALASVEIVVVDDGSTDGAFDALSSDLRASVTCLRFESRCGKAAAVNAGIRRASGDVVVFTDARQMLSEGALEALVANFADNDVAAATGALASADGGAEGAFRRYEEALRRWESAWGSPAGATGALYAVRRSALAEIPEETILDDLVIPLAAARLGRFVYDGDARAIEATQDGRAIRGRRLRTLAGNWQIVFHPVRYRRIFSFRTIAPLLCHKFLRLIFPFVAAAFAGVALAAAPSVAMIAVAGALVLGLACLPAATGAGALVVDAVQSLLEAPVRALLRYAAGRESALWARP